MKTGRKVCWLLILMLVVSLTSVKMTAKASFLDKRVLFISSYSYAWTTVQKQIEGMTSVFGEDITLDYEFIDYRRVYDDTSIEMFYQGMKYRLENEKPYDVIIVGDDPALSFALTYQAELFADTPILFFGINNESLALSASRDPMITGFVEKIFPEENLKLALKMKPKAKKVYLILDDSPTGSAERQSVFACKKQFPELEFVEINASRLSDVMLKVTIRNVAEDDILMYCTATTDSGGNQYSSSKIVKLLTDYSKTPIISITDVGIGEGFAGGYVSSMYEAGSKVAQMAQDIMNGKHVEKMEVVKDESSTYLVDELVLKEYGIDLTVIPEDAYILNETPTFYEKYKEVLLPVMVLVTAMLAIILVFCVENLQHKKLLQELVEARAILKNASQHDFLTGLANRSKFMEDFEKMINDKQHCTAIMLDIDNFKHINDTYGHTAGDEALQQVSARLKALQSPILAAYRYAGDEFILILKSTQSKIVEKTAFACRQVFSKSFTVSGQEMNISGSMGIASYPKDAQDLEHVVACADDAMYEVKKNGKNDFAFYHKKEHKENA